MTLTRKSAEFLFEHIPDHHGLAVEVQKRYSLRYLRADQGDHVGYKWRRSYYRLTDLSPAHAFFDLEGIFKGHLKISEVDPNWPDLDALKLYSFDIKDTPPFMLLDWINKAGSGKPTYCRSHGYETLTSTRFQIAVLPASQGLLAKLAYDHNSLISP